MARRVVVVGSGVAGFSTALALRKTLPDGDDVLVVSRSRTLVFQPALLWVPLGLRQKEEISLPVDARLAERRVGFVHTPVVDLSVETRTLETLHGPQSWDVLVLCTGAVADFAAVPGLGPLRGHTQCITTWEHAERARVAYERLLERPGPVVIGAVQGSSLYAPAYEIALAAALDLRRRGLHRQAPITFVTPEPFLGHLGVGGVPAARAFLEAQFAALGVDVVLGAHVDAVEPGVVHLGGPRPRTLPFRWSMLLPPQRGAEFLRPGPLVDEHGFVRVDDALRARADGSVWAAGMAVAVEPPEGWELAFPRGGHPSEEMAARVAENVARSARDEPLVRADLRAVALEGVGGLAPGEPSAARPFEWLVPSPESYWARRAMARWFGPR